ncbi:ribonuclease H-like protein [Armillaria novae-zelandiae]|uniref:ribonuclease H n=1 Tax=Armillaria novae-zelandiae TaxID=153914 RepID=A0AA39KH51_9AGAR|nr:ribonuclease H-like protein [Armillaria novae-zelandiae]
MENEGQDDDHHSQEHIFNKNLTDQGNLVDAFQIFTEGNVCNELPPVAIEWEVSENGDAHNTIQEVYTDGGCTNNGKENAIASAGVWFGENDPRNSATRLHNSLGKPSNQLGEVTGAYLATRVADETQPLKMYSDSLTMILTTTTNLKKNEDKGWTGVADAHVYRALVANMRSRSSSTTLTWVRGHSGIEGNEEVDKLATEGLSKEYPNMIELISEPTYNITGAKIKTISQSTAYKAIKIVKLRNSGRLYQRQIQRRRTRMNLERTHATTEALTGEQPSDKLIWSGLHHKDLSTSTRQFLWMTMHDAYKIGSWWEDKPGYEQRSRCTRCNVTESMEHILFECEVPGQSQVWRLTRKLWAKKESELPDPSFANLLATPLIHLHGREDTKLKGDTRLMRIVISEAAHLIWRLRNERVIRREGIGSASEREIENRFLYSLNERLQTDLAAIRKKKARKQGISMESVLQTWKGVIKNERGLPEDWTGTSGVLVGIAS